MEGETSVALFLTQPVPSPCRDPQCGLCWGLRSLQTTEQSAQRHGGLPGEFLVASAGLLPRGSGSPALDSYLHGGLPSPSQPDGDFSQDNEERLEENLGVQDYEDQAPPTIREEDPEGEPCLPGLLG